MQNVSIVQVSQSKKQLPRRCRCKLLIQGTEILQHAGKSATVNELHHDIEVTTPCINPSPHVLNNVSVLQPTQHVHLSKHLPYLNRSLGLAMSQDLLESVKG